MSQKKLSVLLISNNDELLKEAEQELVSSDFRVIKAQSSHEAKLKFSNESFSLIMIDTELSEFKASEFVQRVRSREVEKNLKNVTPIIIMGHNPEEFTSDFSRVDHTKFIQHPFELEVLREKLKSFGFPGPTNRDVISHHSKKIKKGEFLINEGAQSLEMYWILAGSFVVTKLNETDERVVIGEVYAGELVGEMSFLDNLPRSASVKALEDSEVLVIPHKKFINVMENQPRWFRSLMQTLSQRLRNANKKIAGKYAQVEGQDYEV
ncbi:MAG: hypothetical protein CME62_15400 [Halobacteriovoraceae bacterium]|nr:hypothetical protein [Halobacteriovoraceae bacterium]|tara:strand:- start:28339 stop:29133 length:795 start_codon:yes stop_codon:yes gene_type:complete